MSERRLIKGSELSKFYWRFQEEFLFSTTDSPRTQKISSVVKIYIIRPKPGPFAKNATPRPSGWESNSVQYIH